MIDLSDIGRPAELFKPGPTSPLSRFLMNWAEEVAYRLRAEAPQATGGLGQSVEPEIDSEDDGVSVKIIMDDYWDFVNSGVDGTERSFGSPYKFTQSTKVAGIMHGLSDAMWPAARGLNPKPDQTINSMMWAIAYGVKRGGIEPTHFFDKILTDELLDELQQQLLDQFGAALLQVTVNNVETWQ